MWRSPRSVCTIAQARQARDERRADCQGGRQGVGLARVARDHDGARGLGGRAGRRVDQVVGARAVVVRPEQRVPGRARERVAVAQDDARAGCRPAPPPRRGGRRARRPCRRRPRAGSPGRRRACARSRRRARRSTCARRRRGRAPCPRARRPGGARRRRRRARGRSAPAWACARCAAGGRAGSRGSRTPISAPPTMTENAPRSARASGRRRAAGRASRSRPAAARPARG